jgi:hypothetical protein
MAFFSIRAKGNRNMILIGVFFIACLTIIGLALGRLIWSHKKDKQQSLIGISGITLLIELIKLTQQHRGMHSGFLNGKLEFKEKLAALESSINHYYTNILNFEKDQAYPESLSTHYPFKQWQRMMANNEIDSAESFRMHSALIARQLDALWDMSDEFPLTSNHHIDVRNASQQLVKTLPELAESLGQIRALSVQIASKQEMSSDKKLQLLFTIGKIENHHKNLITPLPNATNKHLLTFIQNVKHNIQNAQLSQQNPDVLFQEATQVIDDLFTVINTGFESLKITIKNIKVLF